MYLDKKQKMILIHIYSYKDVFSMVNLIRIHERNIYNVLHILHVYSTIFYH